MRDVALGFLADFPMKLERFFAALPPSLASWRPVSWEGIPSERLTALEQLCHIRDIERDGYHVRFKRVLEESCPVLPDIPGEPLAIDRQYAAANAEDVLRDFRSAREETISLLSALSKDDLERKAIFEGQPVTLEGLIHFLCSHDHQHLAGLHWLLGKREGNEIARVGPAS